MNQSTTPVLMPSVERVLTAVSTAFEVTIDDLRSRSRALRVSHSRQAAMYLLRQIDYTYTEIGQILGGRDHTTVMYGVDEAQARAKYERLYGKRMLHAIALMEQRA